MICLALEFSSDRRSVALARGENILAEAVEQTPERKTNAFSLIEKVLADAKILREEIEVIAIGLGPGSYAGIRAAIALAQGWQLASGVKLIGISSADAIAAQAQAGKIFGTVNVVIDAQRGEFYQATWEISAAERKEISPLKIISAAEFGSLAPESCFGPTAGNILFPSATALIRLAAGKSDFAAGENLEPVYLREANFVKAVPARTF